MSYKMHLVKDSEDSYDDNLIGYKNKRKIVRTLPQVKVKVDKFIDAARHAAPAGKRISKTGKIYWETRSNRSDVKGTNL